MSKTPPRVVRPIAKKRPATVKAQPKKVKEVQLDDFGDERSSNQSFKPIYFLPLVLLMASAIGLFYLNKTGRSLATMVPGTEIVKEKVEPSTDTLNSVANTESLNDGASNDFSSMDNTESDAATTNNNNNGESVGTPKKGQYYIVVGSFGIEKNAHKLRKKIAADGGAPVVIAPSGDSKFYKVAVSGHNHLNSAVQQMEELRATYGNSIWVLTY